MTGKLTPRLGLMAPVNADVFTPDDFTATFTTLDNTPGVSMVDSYGALPTGLTNAQHGSLYIQRDNRAMWMWSQPTAGSAGAWLRPNAGMLGAVSMAAGVQTSSQANNGVPLMTCGPVTTQGGKWIGITAHCISVLCSSPDGVSMMQLNLNGANIQRSWIGSSRNYNIGYGYDVTWFGYFGGPTTLTVTVYMAPGTTGTSYAWPESGAIWIYEI